MAVAIRWGGGEAYEQAPCVEANTVSVHLICRGMAHVPGPFPFWPAPRQSHASNQGPANPLPLSDDDPLLLAVVWAAGTFPGRGPQVGGQQERGTNNIISTAK